MNRLLGEPSRGSVDLEGVNWSRRIVLLREGMEEEEEEEVWKGDPGHELDGHSRVTFPFAVLSLRALLLLLLFFLFFIFFPLPTLCSSVLFFL